MLSAGLDPILADFMGEHGLPFLGEFLHGTGGREFTRKALTIVHPGETVNPAPEGPFGRLPGRGGGGGGGTDRPVQVTVNIEGDDVGWVKKVRAEIDGRAANVVDRQLGRRGRQRSFAPGGGG